MRPMSLIAVLACLATPVRADLALEYAAIVKDLRLDLSRAPEDQYRAAEARIQALTGRWIPLSLIAGEGPRLKYPDVAAEACDKTNPKTTTMEIVPVGALGMAVSFGNAKARARAHLQYAGGSDFVGVIDEKSTLARVYPNPEEVDPQQLFRLLTQQTLLGRVVVLPAGENLLILIGERRPPEIWGRCGG